MKKLSIAVVVYNEEQNLPLFLQHLQDELQDFVNEVQVLFIDNASTDHTVEILQNWQQKFSALDGKIINRKINHMGLARQQALQESQLEFVVFLDADCLVNQGWMKSLKRTMEDWTEDLGGCGGPSIYKVEKPWHNFAKSLSLLFPWGSSTSEKKKVTHMPTCNYIVHRKKALEVGGFDPLFERTGEDLDFNVRLGEKFEIMYNPHFIVTHLLPRSIFDWFRKMAFYGRAQSMTLLKNKGGLPKEKFIPLLFVLIFTTCMFVVPLSTQILFIICLLIPRLRFIFLSILFYGFGEGVGFLKYFFQLRKQSPSDSSSKLSMNEKA